MKAVVIVGLILIITALRVHTNAIWERGQDAVNYVPRPGTCPTGSNGASVDCGEDCRADQDCPIGLKCCSTACGRTCKTPDHGTFAVVAK